MSSQTTRKTIKEKKKKRKKKEKRGEKLTCLTLLGPSSAQLAWHRRSGEAWLQRWPCLSVGSPARRPELLQVLLKQQVSTPSPHISSMMLTCSFSYNLGRVRAVLVGTRTRLSHLSGSHQLGDGLIHCTRSVCEPYSFQVGANVLVASCITTVSARDWREESS